MNYRKQLSQKFLWVLVALLVISASCGSDDPDPPGQQGLITTINLTFTNNGNTDEALTAIFRDIDGPGGEPPSITGVALNTNSSYALTVEFLNESVTPTVDRTAEIRLDPLDYQVFFVISGTNGATYSYGDEDSQGNPIGLTGTFETASAGNSSVSVVLVLGPNKSSSGVADGNLGNAGGTELIRVQFPVTVQ